MLAWLERNQVLVLAAAISVLVASLAVSFLAGGDSAPALEFHNDSGLPAGTPIRVHVAGAVLQPGVYELREGDRVVDALTAAGGPIDSADMEALNLARRVRDEEQVLVPKREAPAAQPLFIPPGSRLNINTATEAQLGQLPGIGEVYSRRVVDSRSVDGRFATTEDLVARKIIPRATYERIRNLISVEP